VIKIITLLFILLLMTSCLRTRNDIGYNRPGYNQPKATSNKAYNPNSNYNVPKPEKTSVVTTQTPTLSTNMNQKDVARLQISLQEINDQIRNLYGRIDAVEKKVNDQQSSGANINIDSKLRNYEVALSSLEAEVSALKAGKVSSSTSSRVATQPAVKLNAFGRGEQSFKGKQWRQAISEYQLYREQHPSGKDYSEATYKIGVCFQELNMKSEAKVFFQEAISKYPTSKAGKKAKFRLKQF